jgi:hypothetical protein|tara:strand:+ start:2714 stop:4249 length:1536 start_codon:yes stop_codon:yes gene_type:complete
MVNPRIATEELNDFSGGLNLVRDPHRLRDNEVQEAQNCIFRSGLPEKRDGIAEYNSTELTPNSSDIKGIVRGNLAKDASNFLVVAYDGEWLLGNDGAGTFATITGATGFSTTREWSFTQWRESIFGTNRTDGLKRYSDFGIWDTDNWNEAAWADDNGTTNFQDIDTDAQDYDYVAHHQNRLFLAREAGAASRLAYSALDDELTWSGTDAGYIDIESASGEGDWITGIISWGPTQLVIFKQNSIHYLVGTGPSNWDRYEVFSNIGCVAPRSIVTDGNWIYFMSRFGMRKLRGDNIKYVGSKTRVEVDFLACVGDGAGQGGKEEVACAIHDDFLYAAYGDTTSTSNNRVHVYDIQYDAWQGRIVGQAPHCYSVWKGEGDAGELYYGAAGEGKVYQAATSNSDNGSAISFSVTTRPILIRKSSSVVKQFRAIEAWFENASAAWTITWNLDDGGTTGNWTATKAIFRDSFAKDATGTEINLVFTQSSTSDIGRLERVIVGAVPRRSSFQGPSTDS